MEIYKVYKKDIENLVVMITYYFLNIREQSLKKF